VICRASIAPATKEMFGNVNCDVICWTRSYYFLQTTSAPIPFGPCILWKEIEIKSAYIRSKHVGLLAKV